jgi:hypothetical protein
MAQTVFPAEVQIIQQSVSLNADFKTSIFPWIALAILNRVFQTSLFGAQLGRNLSRNFIPT